MRKILAILGALFIVTGVKAQKSNMQKETVKPQADSLVKAGANKQLNKPAIQQKDAKIAPVTKDALTAKIAPVSQKAIKWTPAQH